MQEFLNALVIGMPEKLLKNWKVHLHFHHSTRIPSSTHPDIIEIRYSLQRKTQGHSKLPQSYQTLHCYGSKTAVSENTSSKDEDLVLLRGWSGFPEGKNLVSAK